MPEEVKMCKSLPASNTESLFNKTTQDLTCNGSTTVSTSSVNITEVVHFKNTAYTYSEDMLVAADKGLTCHQLTLKKY